ncbi:MAG: hypothetical protein ABIE70_13110 [bacterium]
MTKKPTTNPAPTTRSRYGFSAENSPWFAPIVFAVMLLALVVLFSPFLFSDQMLYGSDTINAGIFMRSLLIDQVAADGSVPGWDPYIFGGLPYVDAYHGDTFYPLSAMKFFGSLHRMLGFALFLHIFLAGIFMYLTARRFGLSKIAALVSGSCYMFAAYLISMVAPGHDGKIFATALFPLVMYFLESGFESRGYRSFFHFSMMGLVIGVIILSPHLQMSYFMLWAAGLYTLFKMIAKWRDSRNFLQVVRPASLAAYAVLVGLALSAIQFYPGYVYTNDFSPRADSKKGWEWAISWSMHEEEAFSLLIPEFAGTNSQNTQSYYWGKNAFKDNSESTGIVVLFLGLIGLFFSRRRERWFFGGLALFALTYALGATTPFFKLFFWVIPKVESLRAPAMIMFLFLFSFAMLAGMGVQWLRDYQAEKKSKLDTSRFGYLLWGGPAVMLVLALLFSASGQSMLSSWTSLFYNDAASSAVQQNITKWDLALRNLDSIQSGAWFGFLFASLTAVTVWLYRKGKAGTGVLLLLVALPMIDGVRFNSRFIDTFDAERHWAVNPMVQFLQSQPGRYRVMNFGVLPDDMLPYFKIDVVTGYHGNQLKWYDQLLGGPGAKNQYNPHFLNLAGARFILAGAQQQFPIGFFGNKPVREVASFGQAKVWENDNALPRAFLADRYQVIEEPEQIYQRILNGAADFRQLVYLEKEPTLTIAHDSAAADSAWIVSYAPDSVVVGLTSSHNQLMVLGDNYYESWHAFVDDQPATILRAYGTFRAVEVPAGTQSVVFRYKSSRYATGRMITWVTILGLIVIAGLQGYRRRRHRNGA